MEEFAIIANQTLTNEQDVIYSNKALDGSENFGVIYNFLKEINDNGYIDDNNKFVQRINLSIEYPKQ